MKKTTRKAIRQRKICMLLIIILIIVLSILGGGYYLLSQKNAASSKAGGQNSDSRNQTDLNQNSDTVEYKGEIYKYNNHLSNYLFLGIDTRETVDRCRAGRCNFPGVHGSCNREDKGSVYSTRFHDQDRSI